MENLDQASVLKTLLAATERAFDKGDTAVAETRLRRMLEEVTKNQEERAQSVAEVNLALANILKRQGKYSEAEPYYGKAIDTFRLQSDKNPISIVKALDDYAELQCEQGRFVEAQKTRLELLEVLHCQFGEESEQVAEAALELALVYMVCRKYDESYPLYKSWLSVCRQHYGEEHLEVAAGLANLALICYMTGKFEEAEEYYGEAIQLREKLLGNRSDTTSAAWLNSLGLTLCAQSKHEIAQPICRKAMAIRNGAVTVPSEDAMLCEVAEFYCDQNMFEQAEGFCRQALTSREMAILPEHPSKKEMLETYAYLLKHLGRIEYASASSNAR